MQFKQTGEPRTLRTSGSRERLQTEGQLKDKYGDHLSIARLVMEMLQSNLL